MGGDYSLTRNEKLARFGESGYFRPDYSILDRIPSVLFSFLNYSRKNHINFVTF